MPKKTPTAPTGFVAIDFGTSNSAVALPAGEGVRLVALEAGQPTMPTAVFYRADTPTQQFEAERLYGRAAVAAYVEGMDGRLMRSMKSILGSSLLDQGTDIGAGRSVRYRDVVVGYLRHLRRSAEAEAGCELPRVVLGRPVFFVDDDPARDAQAQAALEAAARSVGFAEVQFQFEPIAAALDYEARAPREQLVLVSDIGGGTSDFSLVRVGPARRGRVERRDDILASHGVHLAGTDFDRHVELAAILPLLGYRSLRPARPGEPAREVPSGVYFDLATWHLINTVYAPSRVAELRAMKTWYADPRHHARLMATVQERLGHALAAAAEQAKIDVAQQGHAEIDLGALEARLTATLAGAQAAAAIEADVERIVQAARETARIAGVAPEAVDALYFTGGSTGLAPLVDRIAAGFPGAERLRGDRFASVAQGLGQHARVVFG
ncbi:Putative heat shock protein YegD [Rubrivivax sp. A210]|uniref:Hsp70 family protein n=1 Tax=Rubrivivax sp. A210 TaxID=2772301 RepID=UPI001918F98C|nr:Hsp70 family protein [Rubrivivax sp. A210]CAD5373478.1 Putative heat shock protein YegD [Rubrivivax sp. A210]